MFKLQRYIIFSVFTIIIIGSLKFSYRNQDIINNLFKNQYIFTKFPNLEYKSLEIFPDKWEPLINKRNKVKINISETDQCWNIPPPCIIERRRESLRY